MDIYTLHTHYGIVIQSYSLENLYKMYYKKPTAYKNPPSTEGLKK